MTVLKTPLNGKKTILAFGAESEGVFALFKKGHIFVSGNFGDLADEGNFSKYKKEIKKIFRGEKIDVILTDLHPLYNPSMYGRELAEGANLPIIKVQHHLAHVFSGFGEWIMDRNEIPKKIEFIGLACDGTGYGEDGKIWGGEIFKIKIGGSGLKIERIGHLENQILIGGDLTVREPARMLISIMDKIESKKGKKFIYGFVKKYYSRNQFELLYNQLKQNFNCHEASSTARILDAVSVLLGFSENKRKFKHQAAFLLEKNSSDSYYDLKPEINLGPKGEYRLLTTPLFRYLANNIKRNKKKLATTAQAYLAEGFWKIIKSSSNGKKIPIFFAGGISNNKIISQYLKKGGAIASRIIPRGDAGISFGQIIYYLMLTAAD